MLLLGCLVLHVVLADVIPSFWWVPDVTLVGLVLAVVRAPDRWLKLAGVAGFWMMLWAIRFPVPIGFSYIALGWIIQWVARQWDVTDHRVQCGMVGAISALMTFGLLWLDDVWSWSLVGWALVRVVVTSLTVLPIRWLWRHTPLRVRRQSLAGMTKGESRWSSSGGWRSHPISQVPGL